MPCYLPIKALVATRLSDTGKKIVHFEPKPGYRYFDDPIYVPCGQCVGCRKKLSSTWALRCVHEASLHSDNIFATLTYSPDYLPEDFALKKNHLQDFWKRLRNHYSFRKDPIRYFACGEYGDQFGRPHYHACIFCFHPEDAVFHSVSPKGQYMYTSQILTDIWGKGHVIFETFDAGSAFYVAGYAGKKIRTGRYRKSQKPKRQPAFILMSRRPGIGKGWLDKFHDDVYAAHDRILTKDGMSFTPPRFYDSKLSEYYDPERHDAIFDRREQARASPKIIPPEELQAMHRHALHKRDQALKRRTRNGTR